VGEGVGAAGAGEQEEAPAYDEVKPRGHIEQIEEPAKLE